MKNCSLQFSFKVSLFFLTSILLLGCNPQKLSDKKAIEQRDERIAYLNTLKRQYIPEGVYTSYREVLRTKSTKDKFGNYKYQTDKLGTVAYEISFTGNKLVLLNNQSNIEEEIYFTDEVSITYISQNSTSYGFGIESWRIKKHRTGEIVADILPTIGDNEDLKRENRLRTILSVNQGEKPRLYMWYEFRIQQYDGTPKTDSGPLIDPFLSNAIPFIDLDEMVYSYSQAFGPEYVIAARYEDSEYDLESYR